MNTETPLEISATEVQALLRDDGTALLDCREAEEYELARIDGAVLVPMSEIADRLAELEAHRHSRLVVYCHHGARSLRVARWLRQQNFPLAQSMTGGIDGWSLEIDPQVPRYG